MPLLYSHPYNLLEDAVSIQVRQGTILSSETDVDRLYDWHPGSPFRVSGTTVELFVDHGSAVTLGLVALIHTNLTVQAVIERDDIDPMGSPPDISEAFAIPSINQRGLFSGPRLDLSAHPAKRYTRLLIETNGYPVVIGEWFVGQTPVLSFTHSYLLDGSSLSRQGDTVLHRTHANADLAYERAVGRRALDGSLLLESAAEKTQVEDWRDAARDQARPFLFVPDESIDDAWIARFGSDSCSYIPLTVPAGPLWRVTLPIMQISHGLAWISV